MLYDEKSLCLKQRNRADRGQNLYSIKQRKGGIQLYHLSSQLHHFCENDQIEFSPSKVKIH